WSATSTCPPMERSERYAVFPSGIRMYACTAPAFTRNGRGATYGFSSVSACTRSIADEVFPISMPSPSASIEQVSTQTRSPMPTGRILVTVNGTRLTVPAWLFMSAATAFTTDGSAVFNRIPQTPFSRTCSASSASCASFTAATIRSDWATRFSSGMTVQSLVVTTTIRVFPFSAASFSLVLSAIVHSITSFPKTRSPSGATVVIRPSLFTSAARSATIASAPLSMAVVAHSLFHGRQSTQNCFMLRLLQRLCRVDLVVHDPADGMDKRPGVVALEGVPPHAHARPTGRDRVPDHFEGFKVAALLAACDKDRHRAGFGDPGKCIGAARVTGLDHVGAELFGDPDALADGLRRGRVDALSPRVDHDKERHAPAVAVP